MKRSHMSTKGWHYDTTEEQVAAALKVVESLNKTTYKVLYSEQTKSETKLGFGKRVFYLSVPCPSLENVYIASFDSYANLILSPEFLIDGAVKDVNKLEATINHNLS